MPEKPWSSPWSLWVEHALGAAGILGALGALELAVRFGKLNGKIVPPPSAILSRTAEIVLSGAALAPLGQTLYLLLLAYVVGCSAAITLGVLMGRFPAIFNLFEPLVELVRPLPKPALLPLLILLLGLGTAMKLTTVALAVFFPILINTVQGVRGVDPILINTARTFGHGTVAILRKVILPSALPMIFSGMRISVGLGLLLVILTEMLTGASGLGFLIVDMQRSFKVLDMYAWLVILALLGLALNAASVRVERQAVYWIAPVQ
jgi:ABC-type nitrate/sulfonate/bicarbonate transport system permease component